LYYIGKYTWKCSTTVVQGVHGARSPGYKVHVLSKPVVLPHHADLHICKWCSKPPAQGLKNSFLLGRIHSFVIVWFGLVSNGKKEMNWGGLDSSANGLE
jgi:hypothetical protein